MRHHVFISLLLAALLMAGCSDGSPTDPGPRPAPPSPLPALQAGEWRMDQADGQPLPAYIAHRLVGGVLEQVWVDSAVLRVDAAGRFEQRVFMTVRRDGVVSYRTAWLDSGDWARDIATYELRSVGGHRAISVRPVAPTVLQATERLVLWPGGGLVTSRYVPRSPSTDPVPPPATAQQFRARAVGDTPLPALVERTLDDPAPGAATELHLDSATVTLAADGTYDWRSHQSIWESGNVSAGGWRRVGRRVDTERGTWVRTGARVALTSTLYANRVTVGQFASGGLQLTQGMSPGERPVEVRYLLVTTP